MPDSRSRLGATFRAAVLTPLMTGACKVEPGADGFGFSWLAHTVRCLLPAMVQLGVASPEEVGGRFWKNAAAGTTRRRQLSDLPAPGGPWNARLRLHANWGGRG